MKQIIQVMLVCFIAAGIRTADIDCTTLQLQSDCIVNESTCQWTGDVTRNTCTQSNNCKLYLTQNDCTSAANAKICSWDGADKGCTKDATTCILNTSNNSCNTGAGCKEGSKTSCNAVNIVTWGCEKRDVTKCTSKETPFCIQDYTCAYNGNQTCPAQVQTTQADTACTGPCKLGTFTCKDNCGTGVDEPTCSLIKGCQWAANACTNIAKGCPAQPKKVSDCTNNGCIVNEQTITCQAPLNNKYDDYCLTNSYCSDTTYCNKTNKDICASDIYFCTLPTSCGSTYPYPQCLQTTSKTCSNPVISTDCTSALDKDTCPQLCLWSDGKSCINTATNTDCTAKYKTQDSCNTLGEKGCKFQPGGICTMKGTDYNSLSSYKLSSFTSFILVVVALLMLS